MSDPRVPGYRIDGIRSTSGGFATVYDATDADDGKPVVIKVPAVETIRRDGAEAVLIDFQNEKKRSIELQNKGLGRRVVQVVDVVTCLDGRPALVLEACLRSLGDELIGPDGVVIPERRLDQQQGIELGVELAEAIRLVHGAGIIHGDIKPSNLLRRVDGSVAVADFGASRLSHLSPRVGMGTEGYAARELYGAGHIATERSDQFALGRTIWALITGGPEAPNDEGRIDRALLAVLAKATAEQSNDRYENMAEFGAALRALMPSSKATASDGRSGRRKALVGVAIVVVVLAVAGGIAARLSSDKKATASPGTPQPSAGNTTGATAHGTARSTTTLTTTSAAPGGGDTTGPTVVAPSRLVVNSQLVLPNPSGTQVTSLVSLPTDATASATAGGGVVFSTEVNGHRVLRYQASPAEAPVTLTRSGRSEWSPAAAPTGSVVAFLSDRSGNNDVWLRAIDGSGERQLTSTSTDELGLAWFPDGRRLVVVTKVSGNADLAIVNVATGATQPLVTDGDAEETPAVSPDGKHVAFVRRIDGHPDVFIIDLSTHQETRATQSAGDNTEPAWSPDGSAVLFLHDVNGQSELQRYDLRSKATTTVG